MSAFMANAYMISGPAAARADPAEASPKRAAWLVVAMWACVALGAGVSGFTGVVERLSTDDAMRLVEVRDLMAGQSWFDLVQHRLDPPNGVAMHWSRVIDLPIALTLGLFGLFAAPDLALKLTLVAWPALLLLPALLACASASRTLAGPAAAPLGALMLALSPGVVSRFAPAAIDHHGAQIALALTCLACALKLDRSPRAAVGAGLSAAVMLAIGMETLPHVAAIAAIVALRWGVVGREAAYGTRLFGLSFGLGAAAIALVTLAPSSWSAPACDTLGIGHLTAALVGGIGLAAATGLNRDDLFSRVAALLAVGVLLVAGVALVAPDCLAAPYAALPERLKTGWLVDVQEARPFFASAAIDPSAALITGLPLLALIGVAAWAAMTAGRDDRWPVAIAVGAFATAIAVTLWQVRGASLAYALGGPLLPMAALAIGRTAEDRTRLILAVAGLSPVTLAAVGIGAAQAAGLPAMEASGLEDKFCPAASYRALSRLPAGLALNTTDTGPFILAHSWHSAIAAPYHRNVDGIAAALDAFDGEDETARAVAVSRGAAYVVVCTSDGGVRLSAKARPGGFSERLLSGPGPDWLEPVDLGPGSRLKVWRVLAGRR